MTKFKAIRWAGRIYKCMETGDEIIIPDDVKAHDRFEVGNGYVDVQLGIYYDKSENIVEVV